MIVAVVGNPFGGLAIYGPFNDYEEAVDWCEEEIPEFWSIVSVEGVNDQVLKDIRNKLVAKEITTKQAMEVLDDRSR